VQESFSSGGGFRFNVPTKYAFDMFMFFKYLRRAIESRNGIGQGHIGGKDRFNTPTVRMHPSSESYKVLK
jgi:hypothetical protein